MTDPAIQELTAALAALRAELDTVKSQLSDIQEVVKIREKNGHRRVSIRCTSLAIDQFKDPRLIAVHLGSHEDGGYMSVHYPDERNRTAIHIAIGQDGQPAIRLQGQDYKARVLLTVEKDHGMAAFFAPDYKPGAIVRAVSGGGSFAVLQPDGKARGIFIHSDGKNSPTGQSGTELLLCSQAQKTTAAFRSDADGSLLSLTSPRTTNRASLYARDKGAAVLVHSDGDTTSASMLATPTVARISTCTGDESSSAGEISLISDTSNGASIELYRPDGTTALRAIAATKLTSVTLVDTAGKDAIDLCHAGGLNTLFLHNPAGGKAIAIGATPDIADFSVHSPGNEKLHARLGASANTANCAILDGQRPLVYLTHSENGGTVSAYGTGENPGQIGLTGNTISGGLVATTSDGTRLLCLDGTDHGGRLTINNDLGFQRILLGTYQESSSLFLNHSGQTGVQAIATAAGGIITVHDEEGEICASLPNNDDSDDSDD